MHSENVVATDRRTRKRDQRRDHLLDLAADLVEERGLDGLTMAALGEAADYATASLYTYFPSRMSLVSALQARALGVLGDVGEEHLATWTVENASGRERRIAALARLIAFGDLFLTAPVHHPREFRLQQELLSNPEGDAGSDGGTVIAAAMAVLDLPRRLLADAVDTKAIDAPRAVHNAHGDPVDGDMARTLVWIAAMNGALLLDRLGDGVPATGPTLGAELTHSLLLGWGADAALVADARSLANSWSTNS